VATCGWISAVWASCSYPQAYERGIALFKYPHVKDIWVAYLDAFVKRYGGKKLERARDLYEQAVKDAPPSVRPAGHAAERCGL
jgi:hypothetical protein